MLGRQALHTLRLWTRTEEYVLEMPRKHAQLNHRLVKIQVEGILRGYTGTLCSDCLPRYRVAKQPSRQRCQQCTDVETMSSKRTVPWLRFVQAWFDGEEACQHHSARLT